MNENFKYETIKKLVGTNCNKKVATLKLNCTARTVNRLIIKHKILGKDGFVHGNRDRLLSNTIPLNISLYINEYKDINFTDFCKNRQGRYGCIYFQYFP